MTKEGLHGTRGLLEVYICAWRQITEGGVVGSDGKGRLTWDQMTVTGVCGAG
jgi:hypothetical protein